MMHTAIVPIITPVDGTSRLVSSCALSVGSRKRRNQQILLASLLCVLAGGAQARTWVVEEDGSGDAPTIQAGIDSAATGDIVDVGPGVYYETVFLTGGENIHLRGRLGAASTAIDGEFKRGVLQMDAGIVEGFTLRNGVGQHGPGLSVGQATVVTTPIVRNNIIENNRAALYPDCCNGGGLANFAVGTRIEGNVIRNNQVEGVGGGIYDAGDNTVIENNLIAFNEAYINSGGIASANGIIVGNRIVGNFARFTSGGAELDGCAEFRNNTVLGNSTANGFDNAAGVRLNEACGVVVGNIIAQNRGGGHGIGLSAAPSSTVRCNDLWENDINAQPGLADPTNFSADPLFCAVDPLGSLNFLLRSNSPCAPGNAPSGTCGLVGAAPVGCGTVSVVHGRWGDVKQLFR